MKKRGVRRNPMTVALMERNHQEMDGIPEGFPISPTCPYPDALRLPPFDPKCPCLRSLRNSALESWHLAQPSVSPEVLPSWEGDRVVTPSILSWAQGTAPTGTTPQQDVVHEGLDPRTALGEPPVSANHTFESC